MGFVQEKDGILAVEKFMQTYYKLAYQVSTITDKLIRGMTPTERGISKIITKIKTKGLDEHFKIVDGQIMAKNREVFNRDPIQMLMIFQHVQERNLTIHPETKDALRMEAPLMSDEYRRDPKAIAIFRSMLGQYKNLGAVLFAMHDTHFLDEWMPEFKKLRCRVQHDVYHFYTIDTHSIFAVNELSKLDNGEYGENFSFYSQILKTVQKPEMLTLGLFLHDIGKGEGGNHSVKGAVIAESVTRRLNYSDEEKKMIDFLIQSHLMMPHLSQRRDLDDSELIIKFARSMENLDKLNMLLLLTWGDIRAVGPEAWTDWKGSLLQKLYEKTKEIILKGEFSKEKTQERVGRVKEALLAKFGHRYLKDEFLSFLSIMPPRYFFACQDDEIERHFLLRQSLGKENVISDYIDLPDQGMSEIGIYTLSAPQVFSLITGLMLAHGLSIYRADSFQTSDGHLFLKLSVTDFNGKMISAKNQFENLINDSKLVLAGKIKVDDLIARRRQPEYLTKKPVQKAETKIVIDNDVSAYNTVIDVYTHDRLGLLYDITRTLNQLGCYVDMSKISTKVEQVTDVFYVKDIFGHKIIAPDKLKAIKTALKEVLEAP